MPTWRYKDSLTQLLARILLDHKLEKLRAKADGDINRRLIKVGTVFPDQGSDEASLKYAYLRTLLWEPAEY